MRLVQLAKALGMTGQQLRKELLTVDFGVKPTDREVSDAIAQGVIRFLAHKHGITPDMSALTGTGLEEGEEKEGGETQLAAETPTEEVTAVPAAPAPIASAPKEGVAVLRKLTLEGVSKEAIARQQHHLKPKTKEEREKRANEDRSVVGRRLRKEQGPKHSQEQIKKKEGIVPLPSMISVKEFAEKTGVQVPQVVGALMKNGVLANITQNIDFDTAAIIASELGVQVAREETSAKAEDLLSRNLEELLKDDTENLTTRPPIVVVMGHVDHGKTSILDAIRKSDVVAGESGGITQHIGAYQVVHDGKPVTFLDTPGHQAFTSMRARGAQVTDIAILVVSAAEGVKETTVEAINHAKEADVPVIVAINKMDLPAADPERVKGELAGYGLQPEEWGGTVPMVPCSAQTKQGISDLLDHIVLIAELKGFKANAKRQAVATVIESHLDSTLGPLATVIVNAGTLKVGDAFVCGRTSGKVRAMDDDAGNRLEEVLPSGPARVTGFSQVPNVGDILQAVGSEREARDLLEDVLDKTQETKKGFGDLVMRLSEGKLQQLKVVVKADAQGSLEAIRSSLEKQATGEVNVKVIHGAVGAVTESDVMMAAASEGIILAFRVPVAGAVMRTAEREGVRVREYDVIYTLLEEVQVLLSGLLVPEEQEVVLGHLEVKGVFLTEGSEQIIGGRVLDGIVKRLQFRLMRAGQQAGTGRILSLRKVDKDIKEAKEGSECGMRVDTSVGVEVGDVLEVFSKEFKRREA